MISLQIARREWLEQWRQPAMLAVITALFLILAALVLGILGLLQYVSNDAARLVRVNEHLNSIGFTGVDAAVGTTVGLYSFLIFTQFLGIAGVLAGHSVLHDRQCGTLTFLLLAPVRRFELLLGKVLGAIGPALLLYWLVSGAGAATASLLPVTQPYGALLPPSGAFLVAFLFGGPAWAAFIGAICTVVSSLARDVRAAQQGVWFVLFFMTLIAGFLLSYLLSQGAGVQAVVALTGFAGALATLVLGTQIMQRDLSR